MKEVLRMVFEVVKLLWSVIKDNKLFEWSSVMLIYFEW